MKRAGIRILILLCLGVGASAEGSVWTKIINQASALYVCDGIEHWSTSNDVVSVILPIHDFVILPDGSVEEPGQREITSPGRTVYFPYVLKNTGNSRDSYRLTSRFLGTRSSFELLNGRVYSDLNGNGCVDPGENRIIHYVNDVDPSEYVHLILAFEVPATASDGDSAFVDLVGFLQAVETVVDSFNVSLVKVTFGASIFLSKSAYPTYVSVGDTITYRIEFTNTGYATADTVLIQDFINYNNNSPFTEYVLGSYDEVPRGECQWFSLSENIWLDMEPTDPEDVKGIRFRTFSVSPNQDGWFGFQVKVLPCPDTIIDNFGTATFYSSGEWSDTTTTNTTITKVVNLPDIYLGPFHNPQALPGGEGSADDQQVQDSVLCGSYVTFGNTLLNASSSRDIIEVEVDSAASIVPDGISVILLSSDGVTPLHDTDDDWRLDVGEVEPGGQRNIFVKAFIPLSFEGSKEDINICLKAISHKDNAVSNGTLDRILSVTPREYVLWPLTKNVEPDTIAEPGGHLRYNITFGNSGDFPLTSFNIYDLLSPDLVDLSNVTDGDIHDLNDPARKIRVKGEYSPAEHMVHFFTDTLPPGFLGRVFFEADISTDVADETVIPNVASCMSSEIPAADTTNHVEVYVIRPILKIAKEADQKFVEIGDILNYTVTLSNLSPDSTYIVDIKVEDRIPKDFRYYKGSTKIDGKQADDPEIEGNLLIFTVDTLPPGVDKKITYSLIVGPGAKEGEHKNIALANGYSQGGLPLSNGPVSVPVKVYAGLFREEGFIFGKVFVDENDDRVQDNGERGVPGILLYLDDGTYAITDSSGKYSIPHIQPGMHIVRVASHSIPVNATLPPLSNDFLNAAGFQMVDLVKSGNYKANFRLVPRDTFFVRYEDILFTKTSEMISGEIEPKLVLPVTLFETAEATLRPDVPLDELGKLGRFLRGHSEWKVRVEGHADPRLIHTKEFSNNFVLSEARARVIANVMKEIGVRAEQIIIEDCGAMKPRVPNISPENMALNRRVEVTLIPPKELPTQEVEYRLTLMNNGDQPLNNVTIKDKTPREGEYIEESVKITGARGELLEDNSTLVVWFEEIPPMARVDIIYRVCLHEITTDFENDTRLFIEDEEITGLRTQFTEKNFGGKKTILTSASDTLFATTEADLRKEVAGKKIRDTRVKIINSLAHYRSKPSTLKIPAMGNFMRGSARLDGSPIEDPQVENGYFLFTIPTHRDSMSLNFRTEEEALPEEIHGIGGGKAVSEVMVSQRVPDITYPMEGEVIKKGVAHVEAITVIDLPFTLTVNGTSVPTRKLGKRLLDRRRGIAIYDYFAIALQQGENVITLKSPDTAGKWVKITRTVHVPGAPAHLEFAVKPADIRADGVTRPLVEVAVLDEFGVPSMDGIVCDVVFENLQPLSPDEHPGEVGYQRVTQDGQIWLYLSPAMNTGKGKIVVSANHITDSTEVTYLPSKERFMLVGGWDTREMYSECGGALQRESRFVNETQVGVLGRGRIPGDFLLTFGAKSRDELGKLLTRREEERRRRHFGYESPDRLYPTYGDASQLGYLASSRSGIYARLEKGLSYLLYGDYRTELSQNHYARYDRTLNGFRGVIETKNLGINSFFAEDKQVVVKDETKADGSPGYFYLSSYPVIQNSEQVFIVTRDRYHPDIVLKKRLLIPITDYTIDYETGAVLSKESISSFDQAFNPNYILVIYETESPEKRKPVYGARVAFKPLKGMEVGGLYAKKEKGMNRDYELLGLDASAKVDMLNLDVEIAESRTGGERDGRAYGGTFDLTPTRWFTLGGHYTKRGSGFVNQTAHGPVRNTGTEDYGVKTGLSFTDKTRLNAEGYRKRYFDGRKVETLIANLTNSFGEWLSLGVGGRVAKEEKDTATKTSALALGEIGLKFPKAMEMNIHHEQMLKGKEIEEHPPKTALNTNIFLTERLKFSAIGEHLWGEEYKGDRASFGLEARVRKSSTIYTKHNLEGVGDGYHSQGIVGLRNTFEIGENVRMGIGGEYVRNFNDASRTHTGLNLSTEYAPSPESRVSARANLSRSSEERKYLLEAAALYPITRDVSIGTKETFNYIDRPDDENEYRADGYIGLAYRPVLHDELNIFAVIRHRSTNGSRQNNSPKFINSIDFNYQPVPPLKISARYAGKWMMDEKNRLETYTDLIMLWIKHALSKRFDIGIGGRIIHQYESETCDYGLSGEVGWNFVKNLWVGAGYNIEGLEDKDLIDNSYWRKGPYLRLRLKFTESLFDDL